MGARDGALALLARALKGGRGVVVLVLVALVALSRPPALGGPCMWRRSLGHQFDSTALAAMHSTVRATLARFTPGDPYVDTHGLRFAQTLLLLQPLVVAPPGRRVLLAGEKGHVPVLVSQVLGLPHFRATSWDEAGTLSITSRDGLARVEVQLERVNLEADVWPFEDAAFDAILLLEVLEHFTHDPMHALAEARRVLAPGGHLVLSTPNVGSLASLQKSLHHDTPFLFSQFMRTQSLTHAREFAYNEVSRALGCAGFDIALGTIEAYFPFLQPRHPLCRLDTRLLGSTLFFIGEKKAAAAELDMDCGLYFP